MPPILRTLTAGRRSVAALVCVVLATVGAAYWPGLGGDFVFDDYANLHGLATLNQQPSLYAYLQYVLGGQSSSLGRPLANLTFALQHAAWDAQPRDFIRVNVLIHLLNAALWFGVVRHLQRLGSLPASPVLALATCAVWALLPIHGGAVLYIVQRMALLAGTFVLTGLLLYLTGRAAAPQRPLRGFALMSVGVAAGSGLGTLAKESAALLPLLILVLEGTLLRACATPPRWRGWSVIFLWLPVAVLAVYLCWQLPALLAGYVYRPFMLAERLLTEARVLFLYLAKAFTPSLAGIRFHYDDLVLSGSWLVPWTTAVALAGWALLIAAAVGWRRRAPAFAFAVGWFVAGHTLESTFVPLELVFDHRNYVPSLGPALAVCVGGSWLAAQPRAARLRPVLRAGAALYVAALAAGLWLSASLWGQPLEQAQFWVKRQPESRRAVYHYADLLLRSGRIAEAAALYRGGLERWPDDAAMGVALFALGCGFQDGDVDAASAADMLRSFDGHSSIRVVSTLDGLASAIDSGQCPQRPPRDALQIVDAALASNWLASHRVVLLHATARLLHAAGDVPAALERMDGALAQDPQVPLLQRAITWSLEAGDVARARRYLAEAEASPRIAARTRWAYREEIRGTRRLIELYESLHDAGPA